MQHTDKEIPAAHRRRNNLKNKCKNLQQHVVWSLRFYFVGESRKLADSV